MIFLWCRQNCYLMNSLIADIGNLTTALWSSCLPSSSTFPCWLCLFVCCLCICIYSRLPYSSPIIILGRSKLQGVSCVPCALPRTRLRCFGIFWGEKIYLNVFVFVSLCICVSLYFFELVFLRNWICIFCQLCPLCPGATQVPLLLNILRRKNMITFV